jgi:hypothetical protein
MNEKQLQVPVGQDACGLRCLFKILVPFGGQFDSSQA